jgi:hypothetical protein
MATGVQDLHRSGWLVARARAQSETNSLRSVSTRGPERSEWAPKVPGSSARREAAAFKICDQTGHKSLEMLRVYCRDAELFVGNAAAGLL